MGHGRRIHRELRKQTRILQQQARRPRVNVAVSFAHELEQWQRRRPAPARRRSWTQTLTAHPEREVKWWIIWAAVTVFCAIPSPASLLFSLPVGVYLFWCRQQAAKNRRLAILDRAPADAAEAARLEEAFRLGRDSGRASSSVVPLPVAGEESSVRD